MGIYYNEGIFGLRVERRDDGSTVFEAEFAELTTAAAVRLGEAVREDALGPDGDFYFCARECFSTTLDYPPRADVGYSWTRMAPGEIRAYLAEFVAVAPAREARAAAARDVAEALRARREHCGIVAYGDKQRAEALRARREHCGIVAYGDKQRTDPMLRLAHR